MRAAETAGQGAVRVSPGEVMHLVSGWPHGSHFPGLCRAMGILAARSREVRVFVGSLPQACMRGLEWEPGSAALRELLEEAAGDLTLERLSQAREEAVGGGGTSSRDRGDHRAELAFHFPEVRRPALWQL